MSTAGKNQQARGRKLASPGHTPEIQMEHAENGKEPRMGEFYCRSPILIRMSWIVNVVE